MPTILLTKNVASPLEVVRYIHATRIHECVTNVSTAWCKEIPPLPDTSLRTIPPGVGHFPTVIDDFKQFHGYDLCDSMRSYGIICSHFREHGSHIHTYDVTGHKT